VNVGTFVIEPYVPAVTAVSFNFNVCVPAASLYVAVNPVPPTTVEPIKS